MLNDFGSVALEELLEDLKGSGQIWVRMVAAQRDDVLTVTLLDAVQGEKPPRWKKLTWDYGNVVFVSARLTNTGFVSWLQKRKKRFANYTIILPNILTTIRWERYPSRARTGLESLLWPVLEYNITSVSSQPPEILNGMLIGQPESPSFQSFAAAAAAFFCLDLPPGSQFTQQGLTIRRQDISGRIKQVFWEPFSLKISLERRDLTTSTLELASQHPGESRQLSKQRSQQQTFFIPSAGLEAGSWILLKANGKWLDYKFLNWPYSQGPDEGVEIFIEEQDEIMSLISQGESSMIEFKEKAPEREVDKIKLRKEVSAFANTDGGDIFLGIDDDGKVVGLGEEGIPQGELDRITNIIKDGIDPIPNFDVRSVKIESKVPGRETGYLWIIRVSVRKGLSPPYGVGGKKPEYFIRRGATSFPATSEQIRITVQASLPLLRQPFFS